MYDSHGKPLRIILFIQGSFLPMYSSSVHPSICQRLMRVTAIKAAQTSFSSVTWLPRDIVPPACPGLPHSLPPSPICGTWGGIQVWSLQVTITALLLLLWRSSSFSSSQRPTQPRRVRSCRKTFTKPKNTLNVHFATPSCSKMQGKTQFWQHLSHPSIWTSYIFCKKDKVKPWRTSVGQRFFSAAAYHLYSRHHNDKHSSPSLESSFAAASITEVLNRFFSIQTLEWIQKVPVWSQELVILKPDI